MKSIPHNKLVDHVRLLPYETILAIANKCDGHTIFKPAVFIDVGLPRGVIEHFTRTHSSDGSIKGTIFVEGQPVRQVIGVYGLDVLRFLADALGVHYPQALGRGFEARNIQTSLKRHFNGDSLSK